MDPKFVALVPSLSWYELKPYISVTPGKGKIAVWFQAS